MESRSREARAAKSLSALLKFLWRRQPIAGRGLANLRKVQRPDGLADGFAFMAAEIVHDHLIVPTECGCEHL